MTAPNNEDVGELERFRGMIVDLEEDLEEADRLHNNLAEEHLAAKHVIRYFLLRRGCTPITEWTEEYLRDQATKMGVEPDVLRRLVGLTSVVVDPKGRGSVEAPLLSKDASLPERRRALRPDSPEPPNNAA